MKISILLLISSLTISSVTAGAGPADRMGARAGHFERSRQTTERVLRRDKARAKQRKKAEAANRQHRAAGDNEKGRDEKKGH